MHACKQTICIVVDVDVAVVVVMLMLLLLRLLLLHVARWQLTAACADIGLNVKVNYDAFSYYV